MSTFNSKLIGICLLLSVSAVGSEYYFDPDVAHGDGSESSPWSSLGATEWATLNSDLLSENVTLYFSSLDEGGVVSETFTNVVSLARTNSSHRLTMDGWSKWNTSNASPAWTNNATAIAESYDSGKVFKIVNGAGSIGLGWNPTGVPQQQPNITIRGFELTGTGARVKVHGDNTIIEYVYAHDITAIDPTIYLTHYTFTNGSTNLDQRICATVTNIALLNSRIERQVGEAVYLGATLDTLEDTFELSVGNSHSGITVSNVAFADIGINGGQGDAVDTKRGITNLRVSDCAFSNCTGISSIVLAGDFSQSDSGIVIERSSFFDNPSTSAEGWAINGSMSDAPHRSLIGVAIRNCTFAQNRRGVKLALSSGSPGLGSWSIDNCSFSGQNYALQISGGTNVSIRNNVMLWHTNVDLSSLVGVTMDFNKYWPDFSSSYHGSNDSTLSSTNVFVSYPYDMRIDFNASQLIGGATNLSLEFTDDFTGATRTAPWDIGAYELIHPTASVGSLTIGTLIITP